MTDPLSLTVATLAFVDPAIRAVKKAYGIHRLNRAFGSDFVQFTRRLEGQKARLEEWSQWPLDEIPSQNDRLTTTIIDELASMEVDFTKCSVLREKYVNARVQGSKAEDILGSTFSPLPASTPLASPSESTVGQRRSKLSKFLGRSRNTSLSSIGESDALSLGSNSQAPSISEQMAVQSTPGTSFSFPSNPSSPRSKQFGPEITEDVDPDNVRFLYKVTSRHREAAESLQRSTSLYHRAVWIAKDREVYKTAVANITRSNDLIESLLRSHVLRAIDRKASQKQGEVQERANIPESLPDYELGCMQSLTRLHESLSHLPSSQPTTANFGLRIASDHSLTRESVSTNFPELPLRDNSSVFLLQARQTTREQRKDSMLLLVEDSDRPEQLMPHFEPFEHLADIRPRSNSSHLNRVFQDTTSWTECATLQDIVATEEAKPGVKARILLAGLLAHSHLHTSTVPSQTGNSELQNFRFFDVSSEVGSTSLCDIAVNEDLLLNIYHFCNLGKLPAKSSTRALGAMVNTRPSFDTSVIDLGLLLYQVGCWKQFQPGTIGRNRDKLKEEVYSDIHELYRQTGLRFAETVQSCLQWDRHLPRARMANLEYFYRDIITPLLELKADVMSPNLQAG